MDWEPLARFLLVSNSNWGSGEGRPDESLESKDAAGWDRAVAELFAAGQFGVIFEVTRGINEVFFIALHKSFV